MPEAPGAPWWRWFLAGGVGLVVLRLALPPGAGEVVEVLVCLGAVVSIELGWRRHRPRVATPWRLLGLGLALWLVSDVVQLLAPTVPTGAFSGPAHLTGYVALALALHTMLRAGQVRRDLAGALDAVTAVVSLGVLAWLFLAQPLVVGPGPTRGSTGFELAYLFGDLVLVGGVVRVATSSPTWPPAMRLLMGAIGCVLLDRGAELLRLAAGPVGGGLVAVTVDAAYPLALVLGAAAVLHPSMVELTEPRAARPYAVRLRLSVAGVCACLPVLGVTVQWLVGREPDLLAALLGTGVVVGLLMGRQQLAFDRIQEVTAEATELRDQLAFEATHDALTLLPNRAHGLSLLQDALDRLVDGGLVTVMFIDLDGFKRVNDVYGHAAGDQLLRRVAERLQRSVRDGDVAVRLGGDEFVVVLETLAGPDQARSVAGRLIESLSRPVALPRSATVGVGASIGIAQCDDPTAGAAQLLADADVAAYRAKTEGKGRCVVYDETLAALVRDRDVVAEQLRAGIVRDELLLHYQPVVDSVSGVVRGYESLVRWQHPTLGLLSPDRFLPAAEGADLIGDVDRWVLHEACAQLQRWVDLGQLDDVVVAVNLSPATVAHDRVVRDVGEALRAAGLRPDRLVLELPERVLQDATSVAHLRELRDLGVSVSVCDFGAAVGQLARLADLPVNVVKISRDSLDLETPLGSRLLQLMIQGAHAVGLNAVAEGVERADQLMLLRSLDCEMVQGFHVARPMPATAVPAHHATQQPDPVSRLIG